MIKQCLILFISNIKSGYNVLGLGLTLTRSMMSRADLPTSFCGFALETATFLLNCTPTKAVEKTPYEIWTGRKPNMSFLRIWGCESHVKKLTSGKIAPKTDKCLFVGYPKETKG